MAGERAATYARYSTDLQSEKSIEDQQRLCHEKAKLNGWAIVRDYADRAKSGASVYGRPGLAAMIEAARGKEFDVLLVESADRISRSQAELLSIYELLKFNGVRIVGLQEGDLDTMKVGLRGLIGQIQLEDTSDKVRRGMVGLVDEGRNPGGKAYGYRPVKDQPGALEIVEDEARVIRRIFKEYAEGRPARQIAAGLNADGILPPRGGHWAASAINGNARRGHGILLNPLYHGELVWNRVRMVKNPETGKRVSRPNPESEWRRKLVPELAIVPEDLWKRVQDRRQARSEARRSRTPVLRKQHLFAGLLVCGECGGKMVVKETDKAGRVRVQCSRAKESRTCGNRASFYIDEVERFVVTVFEGWMALPETRAQFSRLVREAIRTRSDTASIAKHRRALKEIEAQQANLVELATTATNQIPAISKKMEELETMRIGVVAQLDAALSDAPDEQVIEASVAAYEKLLAGLPMLIRSLSGPSGAMPEAQPLREEIRNLFDRIVINPGPPATIEPIMSLQLSGLPSQKISGITVVAEEGLEPPTRGL
jgi:site-specific DNA recombinase